ncbi:GAF domain-containing sensor histidine kinase [Nocardioides daeguensis]|uniref:GAF domain-containing protein n=1 Tax=Nocardioides daeguensis TaxID=908359 RepID=A0ABP6VCH7_9ACTN|nr:GAF domain-containing sensor histidine kinase [Nocardioides daeguensis]MBV6726145.1 GAF domain-containing sensor histidine kinase [Nocardioides daeguensis]MCR1771988.1 GAF domain-containing sensor histidine kinase [Nocardioides daeguensis]
MDLDQELELPAEARALLDAVVAIGSGLDLRGLLTRIVEASCRLTDAEYGVLGIVDDEGDFIDLVPNAAVGEQFDKIGMMPKGHGLLGLVPRERRTIRVDHVAEHPVSSGSFPKSHPVIDRFLGAPVLVRDTAFGHLYLGNKRGGVEFTATDQALVEALARAAGTMIDNARTYEQVEWRRRWLAGTQEVGRDLTGTASVEDAVDELVESLRELCDARLVAYVRVDAGLLEVQQVAGDAEAAPRVVERYGEQIREATSSRMPERVPHDHHRTTLVVPVPTRLAGPGAILVEHAEETPSLRDIMLDLVSVTATQLGLILDRGQALRERAQLLVARDRDRIARDLHDLVIQRLFATGMQLQGARGLDATELRTRVDGAIAELDGAIGELRSVIFELGTESGRPLLDDVRTLLAEYAPVLGFQPLLRIQGPVDRALVPEAGAHVLGTLREALSNVARHAGASTVTVEVTASSAWFRLRVIDDGAGFDPTTVTSGSGTGNLRSRAESLGGHLLVTSAPGQGTTLEWVIPAVG